MPGAPIEPGGLLWEYAGDARALLFTLRTGVLQTMHPVISQALLDHSSFFDDPFGRLARSAGPILGVIYDGGGESDAGAPPTGGGGTSAPGHPARDERAPRHVAAAGHPTGAAGGEPTPVSGSLTGREIRDWHRHVRSDAPSAGGGQGYRALDPEVFFWAHATFVRAVWDTIETFGLRRPMTAAEAEGFYAQSITWYRRYGMSMAPVPASAAEFRVYWDRTLDEVLEATPVAREAVTRKRVPTPLPHVPGIAWPALEPSAGVSAAWLARGGLPPAARAKLGVGWSRADQVAWDLIIAAMRTARPLTPHRLRWLPRSAQAAAR